MRKHLVTRWLQMLQSNCHLLFNLYIDSEVPALWKSSKRQSKTTWYRWGRTVPILVSLAIKKHHRMLKQEATLTLGLLVALNGLCLVPDGGGTCCCSSLGSHPAGQLSLWAHPWEYSLSVPAPPPLLLLCRILQMFLPEEAAAALNLAVSNSAMGWLYPALMELLIVAPFPSLSLHKH